MEVIVLFGSGACLLRNDIIDPHGCPEGGRCEADRAILECSGADKPLLSIRHSSLSSSRQEDWCGVRHDSTVLEIGCGRTAPCLQKLRGRAGTLYGIDLVEFSVLGDDLILLNEDVTDMKSIAANAIDLSFSRSVMEHVEDVDGAYREIFRVLKPGGRYIFSTPNRYDYASVIASLVPNRFHSRIVRHTEGREEIDTFPTLYRSNSFTKIRELSSAAGFEVLELARLVSILHICNSAAPCFGLVAYMRRG